MVVVSGDDWAHMRSMSINQPDQARLPSRGVLCPCPTCSSRRATYTSKSSKLCPRRRCGMMGVREDRNGGMVMVTVRSIGIKGEG